MFVTLFYENISSVLISNLPNKHANYSTSLNSQQLGAYPKESQLFVHQWTNNLGFPIISGKNILSLLVQFQVLLHFVKLTKYKRVYLTGLEVPTLGEIKTGLRRIDKRIQRTTTIVSTIIGITVFCETYKV